VLSDPIGGLDNLEYPVSVEVSGLDPASIYHFRVVAVNFTGTTIGADETFITPDIPRVDSTFASAVGETSARLGARVAANTRPTTVRFEFGKSSAYGDSTDPVSIGSDLFPNEAAVSIGGLTPGTTYHYRAVATNDIGTTYGPDQTFTTASAPPERPSDDCGSLARRARRSADLARRLRRSAAKSSSAKRSRTLRERARALAKQGRQLRRRAKVCTRKNGGNV
jgi:hypothetical protein